MVMAFHLALVFSTWLKNPGIQRVPNLDIIFWYNLLPVFSITAFSNLLKGVVLHNLQFTF